jgi:FkbH-like protein
MSDSLAALATTFLAATDADERRRAFGNLTTRIRLIAAEGHIDQAIRGLRWASHPGLDFTSAHALARLQKSLRFAGHSGSPLRLAILGNLTLDQLTPLVDLYLFAAGIDVEIYTAPYGTLRQEILDSTSGLFRFRPQITFLATSWRDLAHVPNFNDDSASVNDLVASEVSDWSALWQRLIEGAGGQVVQNNFDAPPARALDNHDRRHPAGLSTFIDRVNLALAEQAPSGVTIHDLDHLAACAGRWAWSDERFFHLAKLPCAPECHVGYAHSAASVIAALRGVSHKCLVLDLDNTLWGGIIGDDGLGGIRLGQGDAEGEAFAAFQRYVLGLRRRGVLLAVCSKNHEATAREVFGRHSEMVLRPSDIACFVANWDDKATNLRRIARELNIGMNALVFVDDNPAERALVRELTPDVAVPEMPADPADYVRALESHRYFQITALAAEDLQRTDFYKANAERAALESSAESVESFLQSLRMTARLASVTPATVERAVQLVNKSNQFNLTTRRTTPAELLAKSRDPDWVTITVSLADRFGDNGLISVILARRAGAVLGIDTWLMSCRVLKRGVEHLVLNELARAARSRGLTRLIGEYIPTPKNALVTDHYAGLGFAQTAADADGRTTWELRLDEWSPRSMPIEVLAADEQAA